MKLKEAKKLHNHDQITIKKDSVAGVVINDPSPSSDGKMITLNVVCDDGSYRVVLHTEIK